MADKTYKLKIPLSDGTVKELPFTVPQGEKGDPGVYITGAEINDDGHLMISLSEGDPIDAGVAKGNSSYIQVVPDGNNGYYINITNEGEETQSAYVSSGKTPLIYIKDITGGHRVEFYVNESLVDSFDVMDGEDGKPPAVSIEEIDGGHRVTIGDESFDVMDGVGGGSGLSNLVDGETKGSVKSIAAAKEPIGYNSIAAGSGTSASGENAFAFGLSSKATGRRAFAIGTETEARGTNSFAEGLGTVAASFVQHVEGSYNIVDEENRYLHIVGNGSLNNPSNAHTIDRDGNAWFKGKVFVGGTGQDDPNAKELGTGGGGATSWNDLADKPFGNETAITVLPETALAFSGGETVLAEPLAASLIVGETHIVNWNGTEYNCVAQPFDMDGLQTVVLGDLGALTGGTSTGEPFIFMEMPPEAAAMGMYAAIMALDGSEEANMSIAYLMVEKIPENLLPPMIEVGFVEVTGNNVAMMQPNVTFESAMQAAMSGKMLFLKMHMDIRSFILPLVQIENDSSLRFAAYRSSDSYDNITWHSDGTFTE